MRYGRIRCEEKKGHIGAARALCLIANLVQRMWLVRSEERRHGLWVALIAYESVYVLLLQSS